ncbi:MAG: hypothetical protein WBB98_04925 [Xanthobacteraceae bacterium]
MASKVETPRNLAKRLFDRNKRNKEKTVAELIARSENQKMLRDYLIKLGASAIVSDIVILDRRVVLDRMPEEYAPDVAPNKGVAPKQRGQSAQRVVRQAGRSATVLALLDFPLPTEGNKLLRDANYIEVYEAAQHYRGSANNALKHAAWLSAVAAQLPKGKVVSDVFDDRKLTALFKNTGETVPKPRGGGEAGLALQ